MTDTDQLKLSRIYRSIVNDIEDILGVAIIGADEAKIIESLDAAVGKAVNVVNTCSCGSSNTQLYCNHCERGERGGVREV